MSMDFGGEEFIDASTVRGRDYPSLRQFCVILENRVGSLNMLMRQLERHDLRIIALSMVDNVDVAIARIMLDNVERGRELFELGAFTFFETDLIGVELPVEPQPFVSICSALLQAEVNVNYMYPLMYRRSGRNAVAIHVDDVDTAMSILKDLGHVLLTEGDLNRDDDYFA